MVDNPRFPHYVVVSRQKVNSNGEYEYDSDGDPIFEKVLESECGMRDMVRGIDVEVEVFKEDYKLALPKQGIVIKKRDNILFTNSYTGEVIDGLVEGSKTWNFGTNIWFQSNGN